MQVVTFECDEFTQDVKAQLTRDLLILKGQWDVSLWDPKHLVDDAMLSQLGISRAGGKLDLCIVYKTGDSWPTAPSGVATVERDLSPEYGGPRLDGDPQVGYYLRPQGKGLTNRTEFYLGRAYPRGQGIVNPLVTLLWGGVDGR